MKEEPTKESKEEEEEPASEMLIPEELPPIHLHTLRSSDSKTHLPTFEVQQVLKETVVHEEPKPQQKDSLLALLAKPTGSPEKDQRIKLYSEVYTTEKTYIQCLEIMMKVIQFFFSQTEKNL